MDVWEILGIEPTQDLGIIRRAYAEKAKRVHPEDDPEGFIRLRDAYKRASAIAKGPNAIFYRLTDSGRETADEPTVPPESPAPSEDTGTSEHTALSDTFDYAEIERISAQKEAEERAFFDSFFARAKTLSRSRKDRTPENFRALFAEMDTEKTLLNPYFFQGYLDFISSTPHLPLKVRKEAMAPFSEKLRVTWGETPHWEELHLAVAIANVYRHQKANRLLILQFLSAGLLLLAVLYGHRLPSVFLPPRGENAMELLGWMRSLSFIDLVITLAVGGSVTVIQFILMVSISKTMQTRTRFKKTPQDRSELCAILSSVLLLVLIVVAFALRPTDFGSFASDQAQLENGTLNSGLYVLYSSEKLDDARYELTAIHISSRENEVFLLPAGMVFHPEMYYFALPDLGSDDYKDIQVFQIEYTTNTRIIGAITEVS